jgi:hypothetical protein
MPPWGLKWVAPRSHLSYGIVVSQLSGLTIGRQPLLDVTEVAPARLLASRP